MKTCSCREESHDSNISYVLVCYCSEKYRRYVACVNFCSLSARAIMSSQTPEPQILTTSNYLDWRIDMQLALCKHGYHRIIHGWELEPHHPVERNKFLNHCDEAFGYLCTYISRYLLFHLEGLRTPTEAWEKLYIFFSK